MQLGFPQDLLAAIFTLYERVLARFRDGPGLSQTVHNTIGVKQGCSLSPILFALYIDHLEHIIREEGGDGCPLADAVIRILLYADDVVLISSSAAGLQRHLDILHSFCVTWGLTVNLQKTKIMVFNTNRQTLQTLHFLYDSQPVEIVTSYTYLGVLFTGPLLRFRPAA